MWSKIMDYKHINRYFTIFSYILSVIITILVFFTGGTNKVYANLMYIPIAIVSSTNGKKVGIIHSAISALLVGPFMPLNTSFNISQEPINWITRLLIYVTISFIIGFFSDYNRKNKEYITNLLTHDMITNFKNIEAVKSDDKNIDKIRTVIAISVLDYEKILGFFGYNFTIKAIYIFSKVLERALSQFNNIELLRYDGMKFIITIVDYDETKIQDIINKLEELNRSTIHVDNIPIYIEISLGKTEIDRYVHILEGIRQALIALRYSIIDDRKVVTFEYSLDKHYKDIVDIASNFSTALCNGNIKTAYQNIYNPNTGEVHGMELLARWITDNGTQIYPSDFIPVIEETQLINELTKHIIDIGIKQLLQDKDSVVSINFSTKDFKPEVVDYLLNRIDEENINPRKLQIELTEDILVHKVETIKCMEDCKNKGITIAIDDFGTGYSSLQYLSEFSFDVVKIDKSLIQKMIYNSLTLDLVKSIIGFCKNNNIIIVAEGVENEDIANMCINLGIDLLQGYYFHKPSIMSK